MSNLLTLTAVFIIAALGYRFRSRILRPFLRFEARNAARRSDEARALFDRYAHYRQTIQLAEEQVEEVTKIEVADARTGQRVERFLFQGEQYATHKDAENARFAVVIGKAREFYIDLDRNWLSRRGATESLAAALPAPDAQDNVKPRQ